MSENYCSVSRYSPPLVSCSACCMYFFFHLDLILIFLACRCLGLLATPWLFSYCPTDPSGNPKKLISRMEDAKYCGRDWIPTGNWPQVRYNPAYNRTTPDNLAQVLRCGSSHPSLPLLYLPTSFTLSLSQLGIFQGHYKVWEWLEHIVFMSTSCMFSSHMPYNTLLLHISRNSTHCITRTWHPLSDVVHLTRRDANFHGIAHVGVNRSR